jgi:hypothetical protein
MDAPKQYLEELRGELALYPTWLPGEPIELGAFGMIHRGRFVVDGRLADRDILVKSEQLNGKLDLKKSHHIKFQAATGGSAKPGAYDAELGIELQIERLHAWAFAARGVTKTEIVNIDEVRRAVVEARKAGSWDARWLIVTEVRHAEHLNVLISRSKQTSGRVRGKGTLVDPFDVLMQEDASFELSSDDVFRVTKVKQATPLYGLRKLRGFLDPQLRSISSAPDSTSIDSETLEVANDEPLF